MRPGKSASAKIPAARQVAQSPTSELGAIGDESPFFSPPLRATLDQGGCVQIVGGGRRGGCAGWVTGAGGDGRALRLALNRTSTGSKVDGGYPSTLRSSGGEPSDGSFQFANRGQFGSRRVNKWCDRPQCPTVHVNQIQHQGNLSRGPLRARIRRAPISGVRKSRPVVSTTHDSRRSADTSPFADQAPELTRPNSTGDFIGRSIARFGRVDGE